MADATVKLLSGAVVTVNGTPEEVAEILRRFENTVPHSKQSAKSPKAKTKRREPSGSGVQALILSLKTEGYFTGQRRGLAEVQSALEGKGHIFPVTTLSPTMIRLVQAKELRRIKENGKWAYTHS
jgi:hypothetical protein